jgi:hypothetical protein
LQHAFLQNKKTAKGSAIIEYTYELQHYLLYQLPFIFMLIDKNSETEVNPAQ